MNQLLNLLVAGMLVCCLSLELQTDNMARAPTKPNDEEVQPRNIQIIKDIRTYIQQNPHLRLIRLHKQTLLGRSQLVKYFLGSRVSGDRLVAQYADSFFYPAQKNVSVHENYPRSGYGSVVTAIDVSCLQDNSEGNAYIVGGGIGQRYISIVLEAPQTERFSYNMHIYGKD